MVKLEIQDLQDMAYERGRYQERLNYRQPLDPVLPSEDDAWAGQLLKSAGLR